MTYTAFLTTETTEEITYTFTFTSVQELLQQDAILISMLELEDNWNWNTSYKFVDADGQQVNGEEFCKVIAGWEDGALC